MTDVAYRPPYTRDVVAVFTRDDFPLSQADLDALERRGGQDRLEEAFRQVIDLPAATSAALDLWRQQR